MSTVTITNGILTVSADTDGAVLTSIQKNGTEYLWIADPKYWGVHDKNLFPYVGRLTDEKYLYNGREYHMGLHGFCSGKQFEAVRNSEFSVTLTLKDSEETYKDYPFHFTFSITYALEGQVLSKKCCVTNDGENEMYFGIGSHPGFNVPLNGEGSFEDWYFEFPEESTPIRIGFDQTNYRLSDENLPYALKDGTVLPLQHSCFDLDAIVLENMPKSVTLKSDRSEKYVKATYPDMDFLGLWHKPHSDAPYVCIEPWKSLPSHSAFIEDLAKQEHIVHLPAAETYTNTVTFEIG